MDTPDPKPPAPAPPEAGAKMWLWIGAFVVFIGLGAMLGQTVSELTGNRTAAKVAVVGAALAGGLIYRLARRWSRRPPAP